MGKRKKAGAARGKGESAVKRGPAKRPPPETGENERQLRRLAAFLEDAVGFRLALVTCDTQDTRERQLERLADEMKSAKVSVTRLDLTETPREKQLLDVLRQHVAGQPVRNGKRPAVMVVGLEATLDYSRLGPGADERFAILENANAQRDAFAEYCPVSVVLWLNETASSLFAAKAPDLWHWRSGSFHFSSPTELRERLSHHVLTMPQIEADSLPMREKRQRVITLRDLLAQANASPQANTNRGGQRVSALQKELGLTLYALGDLQESVRAFQESVALARQIGDRQGEASALGNLGLAYAALGQLNQAIGYYEQCLVIHREIGDRRGEGADLGNLGLAYAALSQVEKAIGYYEQHLGIAREIGDRRGEGNALANLGLAYARLGQVEKAIALLEQALKIGQEIKDPQIIRVASANLQRLREGPHG